MYRRLEQAGEVTGLPINSIVVIACLEWLDAHQPETRARFASAQLQQTRQWAPPMEYGFRRRRPPVPFDRFTKRAKNVLSLADEEAERAGQGYIGEEHLLLGLLREPEGVAAGVLGRLGVQIDKARAEVAREFDESKPGPEFPAVPTSRTKKIIETAFHEAEQLGHPHVGTAHLLLGLVAMKESVGVRVLASLGVTEEQVRAELHRLSRESGLQE